MVKKLFRMAITFALLSAAYTGYTRGFAYVAARVSTRKNVPRLPILAGPSRSQREAADLLVAAFGPDNWAEKAPMSYYDVRRGYWIYWHDYKREADGKTWEFWPVWIITRSQKDGALKSISGKKARVDFNRPIDVGKPGEGDAHIVHAKIEDDVRIRDDKATADLIDDLTVGPLKSLEYDETAATIVSTTDDRVVLRERGLTATGIGMKMDLRPRDAAVEDAKPGDAPVGFDGVQAITLLRDVEIDVQDVGRSGIVPGGAGDPKRPATGKAVAKDEPRPGHIQCSGEMRIDLPAPRRQPEMGPPAPNGPTIANFDRNVRVRQGDPLHPEQADGDHLVATLIPAVKPPTDKAKIAEEKAAKAASVAATKGQAKAELDPSAKAPEEAGPLSGLVLHRAVMTGHAVWLQSEAQGTKAVGNQLIFDRQAHGLADRIYFIGDKYTEVVKTETWASGKDMGKPRSISTIRTKDVTIFQYPPGGPPPSVVARGPGTLETRAAGRDEVERFASWQDTLTMVTPPGTEGRKITLTGKPRVRSASQGDITALKTIVADLEPKEAKAGTPSVAVVSADGRPVPSADPATAATPGDALRIKKLVAEGDVRLVTASTPGDPKATPPRSASPARTIVARDRLTADFVDAPAEPKPAVDATPILDRREAPAAVAAGPAVADPNAAPATPAGPAPAAKPADPAMNAIADTVWALVAQQPGSDKGQVKQARLTGDVEVHQDPAAGKTQGMDLTGQVVFLKNTTENRAEVQAQGTNEVPAKAVTEGRTIVGRVLNLDQASDYAWVKGPGYLQTEQADTDLFDDTAPLGVEVADPAGAPAKPEAKPKAKGKSKGPLLITWGKSADDANAKMIFYGQSADRDGEPGPAMAYFYSHVRAKSEDSSLACEEVLKVTFDGPIRFVKPKKAEPKPGDEPEAKPQVAILHARGDVDIVARKVDPVTGAFKDKKRIRHQDVTYDKATGEFATTEGPGETFLYTVKKDDKPAGPMAAAPTVRPVSARRDVPESAAPRVSLTHVRFAKKMVGRFAPAQDAGPQDYSTARFLGSVEAMMATVPDDSVELDADHPPRDFYRIVSRQLDVQVEPPKVKTPDSADRVLLDASGGARAFTRDSAIAGDRITYDSLNELSYVYEGAAGVAIVRQDGAGQPATTGRGSALFHNHKLGITQLIDPQTFQIIDPGSGLRSKLPSVEPPPAAGRNVKGLAGPNQKLKQDRNDPTFRAKQLRIPMSGDKDRKSFTGK